MGILGIAALFLYYWKDLPSIESIQSYRAESTKIYDRTGTVVLYNIFDTQQRDVVNLDQIPYHTRDAVIAIEDDNFYSHFGIDVAGVARAAWNNILRGKISQGGSTITQQFIKNILLTPEQGAAQRTIGRKVKKLF